MYEKNTTILVRKSKITSQLIIGLTLFLIFYQATSQSLTTDTRIKSIQSVYAPIDTLKTPYKNNLVIRVNWMDSVIEINNTVKIQYDLEEVRKFRRDATYVPSPEDTVNMNKMRMTGSQNCHSYALEKFFIANKLDNSLFTQWTSVKENRYMNSILVTAFVRIQSFEVKRKKCKDCSFNKNTVVVFRNKWNVPIHTVYYDGEFFHSKYGGWQAKSETTVQPILEKYWDSTGIEEYQLDDQKISDYLNYRAKKN